MLRKNRLGASFCLVIASAVTLISIGCSTYTTSEDPRSQGFATEEDPVCASASLGDGATCLDYATIKMDAHTLCEADGRVLVDLSLSGDCPNGALQVNYTCCAPTPPDPNAPGGTDANGCAYQAIGDGATCQTEAELLDEATQICEAGGLFLQGFGASFDCPGGESSYAKFGCCTEPAPPPPPPSNCSYHALGDGTTCANDESWQDQAEAVCAADGFAVVEIGLAHDCADGTSSFAKLACCAP